MPRPLIVNASPIIVLAKANLVDLLRASGDPVQVPQAVVQEIRQAGPTDPAVQALAQTRWLIAVDPGPPAAALPPLRLGAGEQAVLTWALANPGTGAILDDPAGRRAAAMLGIPYSGCLGVVIEARRQGVIAAARPVMERLRQVGLRLSDRVMNQALALVGE